MVMTGTKVYLTVCVDNQLLNFHNAQKYAKSSIIQKEQEQRINCSLSGTDV